MSTPNSYNSNDPADPGSENFTYRLTPPPPPAEVPGTRAYSQSYPAADEYSAPYPTGGYYAADAVSAATPRPPRPTMDPGVDIGRYLGSAFFTTAIAALLGAGLTLLVSVITDKWVTADYWINHDVARPANDPVWAGLLSGALAVLAAAVMWLAIKGTTGAGKIFACLMALAAGGFVLYLLMGPWQTRLGPALTGIVVVAVVGSLTAGYAYKSMTDPVRF